jgi:hypothetical protein
VIEAQGERLGCLEGEWNVLALRVAELERKLAESEADRAARLEVIEAQGRQLGELGAAWSQLKERVARFEHSPGIRLLQKLGVIEPIPSRANSAHRDF